MSVEHYSFFERFLLILLSILKPPWEKCSKMTKAVKHHLERLYFLQNLIVGSQLLRLKTYKKSGLKLNVQGHTIDIHKSEKIFFQKKRPNDKKNKVYFIWILLRFVAFWATWSHFPLIDICCLAWVKSIVKRFEFETNRPNLDIIKWKFYNPSVLNIE